MNIAEQHDVRLQANGTTSGATNSGAIFATAILIALLAHTVEAPSVGLVYGSGITPNTVAGTVAISSARADSDDTAARFRKLLQAWNGEDAGYDDRVWPDIAAALQADRLSARPLF